MSGRFTGYISYSKYNCSFPYKKFFPSFLVARVACLEISHCNLARPRCSIRDVFANNMLQVGINFF